MTELHIPTLRRIAAKKLRETGKIPKHLFDRVIEDWEIDLTDWGDPIAAREIWHILIDLYLTTPDVYYKAVAYIRGMRGRSVAMSMARLSKYYPCPDMKGLQREVNRLKINRRADIPDIVA